MAHARKTPTQAKKETLLNQYPPGAIKERDTAQSNSRSKQRERHCSISNPKQIKKETLLNQYPEASKDPEANWVINTSNPETPILKQPIQ
jgi:hypothetical protein